MIFTMSQDNNIRTVYVGLSGGVDSAVSAGLLKEQGFNVVGVFIKIWSPEWINCTSKEDRLDAMRVCAKLDIPFKELDLSEKYKKEVVENMIQEYKNGRTPNPDVLCNSKIKFGDFFDFAMSEEADFIATGHYARTQYQGYSSVPRSILGMERQFSKDDDTNTKLLKGKDKNKDQSYFLWGIKKEQLSKILFPIGNLEKTEVRKLAKKFGLRQATKKDSQGLCFVGHIDLKDFLKEYIEPHKGNVLNHKGEVIGYHDGAEFLTIGERGGFTITKKGTGDKPLFVVAKNIKNNTITVSDHDSTKETDAFKKEILVSNLNWFEKPALNEKIECLIRYRGELVECLISEEDNNQIKVKFIEKTMIAPGQSIVFYRGKQCLGGGVLV